MIDATDWLLLYYDEWSGGPATATILLYYITTHENALIALIANSSGIY